MHQPSRHESEDPENNKDAGQKIDVQRVTVAPQLPNEPRELDRPGEKREENRHEIKGQEQQVSADRCRSMSADRRDRSSKDMSSDTDAEELPVCLEQRRNSPETNNGK